jgi:hypothetical protein
LCCHAESVPTAARCLDLVLEYFGPNGENWSRHTILDGDKRCLVGAVWWMHAVHGLPSSRLTLALLREAYPQKPLPFFNADCEGFAELRAVILKARAAALAESRRPEHPKRRAA